MPEPPRAPGYVSKQRAWHLVGVRFKSRLHSLSLSHQFILVGALLGIVGLSLLGSWIPRQIEERVEAHGAARTALYMEGLVAPHLQELSRRQNLSEGAIRALDDVLVPGGLDEGDSTRIAEINGSAPTHDSNLAMRMNQGARDDTNARDRNDDARPQTR